MNRFAKNFVILLIVVFVSTLFMFSCFLFIFSSNNRVVRDVHLDNRNIDVKRIDIAIKSGNIKIEKASSFGVRASDRFRVNYRNGTLEIEEKVGLSLFSKRDRFVVIYVNKELSDLDISFGTGKVELDGIRVLSSNIDGGAGSLDIRRTHFNNIDIENGTGSTVISDSTLNNLDLTLGVGSVKFRGDLTGKSRIDCGVGSVSLELLGSKKDYLIKVEKGIGSVLIDNHNISEGVYGNGKHLLELEGGIGSIKVDFRKE